MRQWANLSILVYFNSDIEQPAFLESLGMYMLYFYDIPGTQDWPRNF